MLIGFDASRAFIREATGTENYSLNLLRALAKVDRKNRYRVYLRGFSSLSLRDHEVAKQSNSKIATSLDELGTRNDSTKDFLGTFKNWPSNFVFKIIRPSRFWTQFGLALETWRAPVDLLFVPAHTLPILRRRNLTLSSQALKQVQGVAILKDCFASLAMTNGRRMRTIVTIHDLGVEYLPGYHQFPQRYYLDFASRYGARHADAIIAVSQATKDDLIQRYKVSTKKVFVVSEGVDKRFFKPQSEVKVESVKSKYKISGDYILFVGTVQPRKNLQMLIKAFSLLVGRLQTTDLIIAGKLGWDYQEILDAPKRLGVEKLVRFLGHVPNADLPALYSGAVVFAAPSLFEGFGLPILEALACGCLVVASDIAPHREIFQKISRKFEIRNSKFEIASSRELVVPMTLVKPKDIEGWVDVLYQYVSQYEKRSSYRTYTNVNLDFFSWERVALDTLQLFRQVLS